MSSEISDPMKAITTQAANAPTQPLDPQVEAMLQSLLIEDPSLMRILKGEIQEVLNKVEVARTSFEQQSRMLFDHYKDLDPQVGMIPLKNVHNSLAELKDAVDQARQEAKKYRRYVPYLLLFTSSSVLSNVTDKEAKSLWRKIDIMVSRDQLESMDDETALEDLNFFDSIRIKAFLHILRNVNGHTFRGLIEEKRTVQNIITDQTQQRKRKFGIF